MSTNISAEQVKELRQITGSGMMECKRALEEAQGNLDLALDNMRKKGQAQAGKKAGRIAAEGIIIVRASENGKAAVIIEINSETDFAARDENLKQFAQKIADIALHSKSHTLEALLSATQDSQTVEQLRTALIAKIGENIQISRIEYREATGVMGTYLHGGRIGVLVDLTGGDAELAKDIAMHIAATSPLVVNPSEVSEAVIAKETEIFTAQAIASGKPKEIAEKMVSGRIKKFLDEVSLLGQPFVKDPSLSVGDLLKKASATVNHFIRFAVGEGIEKETAEQKAEKFKSEVMAQARGN